MKDRPYTREELVNDPSFIKWATGRANTKEARLWDEWIEASERHRQRALQAQKSITGVSFDDPPLERKQEDWKRIAQRIATKKRATRFRPPQRNTKNSLGIILKVAAVLLITTISGLAALHIYQQSTSDSTQPVAVHTVTTDFSEKKTIILSDDSEIILAAGSTLAYRDDWLRQPTKRVTLLEGEAFFSIQPAEKSTPPAFEVETEDGTTAVRGTKFTVSTYGKGTQVVLQEGAVEVTVAGTSEDSDSSLTLSPGEMAQWQKQQPHIALQNVNPRVYTSWISDHLFFDDTPLSVLVSRIEQTYGVNVQVNDPALLDLKLSGAIDFRSMDALMNAVSEVLDIRISRIGEQVIRIEKEITKL